MAYNASSDLWYQYFKSADGPQWFILLAMYGCRALWATFALFLNGSIVYITVKGKSLRSICNILIAMESGFSLILDLGYFISFSIVLLRKNFVPYGQCFWFLILPAVFGDLAQFVMIFTGIDRVFAVAFPFWYKTRNPIKYSLIIGVFIIVYIIFEFISLYIDQTYAKEYMVSCSSNEIGLSPMGTIFFAKTLIFSAITIIIYLICWFLVFKYHSTAQHVSDNNRKLVKALLFIIGLNLIGVATKSVINLILSLFFTLTAFIKVPYSVTFSFLTITVYAVNAPVLYMISTEYRCNFNKYFPWLTKMFEQHGANTNTTITTIKMPTDTNAVTIGLKTFSCVRAKNG